MLRSGSVFPLLALLTLCACPAPPPDDTTVVDTGDDPGTASDAGTDTGSETDSGTDVGTETDPGTGTDTGTDSGTDTGTGTEVLPPEMTCPVVEGVRVVRVVPVQLGSDVMACDRAALESTWFGSGTSVSTFWDNASAGRIAITGTGVDTVTVAAPTGCIGTDPGTNQVVAADIGDRVDAALAAAGITDPVDLTVYALPESVKCGPGGPAGATLPPGKRIMMYTDAACASDSIAAHEMGHALGLQHAGKTTPTGTFAEYADPSDIMGSAYVPPNGPHRAYVGWMEMAALTPVDLTQVTAPLVVELAPLGDDANPASQLIEVTRAGLDTLYLSYRVDAGIDASMDPQVAGRLSVHTIEHPCPNGGPSAKTDLIRLVQPDTSYTTVEGDLQISPTAATPTGLTVTLTHL